MFLLLSEIKKGHTGGYLCSRSGIGRLDTIHEEKHGYILTIREGEK